MQRSGDLSPRERAVGRGGESDLLGHNINYSELAMGSRIRFSDEQRKAIFDRTRGKCHICHASLAFSNYGHHGRRGAWHIDHSIAVANGGTNHRNNLYVACISCNLDKGTATSRTARSRNGRTRAPLSRTKHAEARTTNAVGGGALGAGLGALFAGPPGALIGGLIGMAIGSDIDSEK